MNQRGFVAIPNHVIRDSTLPASARLLYGIILSYAYAGHRCTASTDRLCDEAGIKKRAFWDAVKLLRERKLLIVEAHVTKRGRVNSYAVVSKVLHVEEDRTSKGGRAESALRGSCTQTHDPSCTQTHDPPSDHHYVRAQVPSAVEEDKREEDNYLTALSDSSDEKKVFNAWIEATNRTGRTVLSPQRRKLIHKALSDYSLPDLIDAVQGWRNSPHHRGENAQGTVYNDLELLLRDAAHIERFRDLNRGDGVNGTVHRRETNGDLIRAIRSAQPAAPDQLLGLPTGAQL